MVQAAIDKDVRTKKSFELEHRIIRNDGTVGWSLLKAIPLLKDEGTVPEWFGATPLVWGLAVLPVACRAMAGEPLSTMRP